MNWTALLKSHIESTYHAAEGLMRLVDPGDLSWKPATGSNWMTTAQLLQHMTEACGLCVKGFVADGWGDAKPAGAPGGGAPEGEAMLPGAEKMPAVASVGEALQKLAADKALALEMLKKAGETALAKKTVTAPWDPEPMLLGQRLLSMVSHLGQHKGQLFYYLKLMGKPVHTGHLWGM